MFLFRFKIPHFFSVSILLLSFFCRFEAFSSSNKSAISNFLTSQKTRKVTRIPITQGHVVRDPIACVPLFGRTPIETETGKQVIDIIKNDLNGCGLFHPIPEQSFLQTPQDLVLKGPQFATWGVTKVRFLICGLISSKRDGYEAKLRVFDVNCGTKLLEFSIELSQKTFRKAAHKASDRIFSRITGEKGMFNTSLAYIETVPEKVVHGKRVTYLRQLKIMDQDGFSIRALTNGNDLVMTPRFSPDGKTIAYLVYKTVGQGKNRRRTAQVYLLDLQTMRQKPLLTETSFKAISQANGGSEVNMSYAPRFSPDGQSLCFALIIKGKSAIYTMNLAQNKIRRLTPHIGIDTSPAYSHDGKKIVFTSNRSGKEKIYIMNADGSQVQRITHAEGKYSQPVFSPRGDFIAFSKQIGNQFFIGVVRPNGQEERIITQGYLTESPCWSANGRYIAFTRQASPRTQRRICMIDLTGYFMKEILTQRDAYDCTWSPLED